jgi:hypothetical protein
MNIVPDRRLVKSLDSVIQGVSPGDSMCEGGGATQAKPSPSLSPQETGSI